ncbi:RelA/SpoT domain-containing protein [Mesorhizobium australicum]|uniref:RelA/SpoT domain-containing protein n=1 Tax=Mesorhizobium australicum TaxID=536018 RepID=UPI00333CF4C0
MKAVRKAGDRLAQDIAFSRDITSDEFASVVETFAVANSFRDSHIMPMRSVFYSVRHKLRQFDIRGDMAARPKRMPSIRRKLGSTTVKFDQMNDLGGCRAIMHDIRGVRTLIAEIEEKFPHAIRQRYPYIDRPKPDGYRSHHMVFTFQPGSEDQEVFAGRRVELQIRTRLQHSWATAVEAAGLYRGEDYKHGQGDQDWRRLFELAGAEFSYVEECPIVEGMPDHGARIKELRDLNQKLRATSVLENIKNATHFAETNRLDAGKYFLIRYRKDHTVVVEGYDSIIVATQELGEAEFRIVSGQDDDKVVLVEVGKISKLVQMYPNYFGDVSLFVSNLREICDGRKPVEYSMAKPQVVAVKPREAANLGALYRRYTRWFDKR